MNTELQQKEKELVKLKRQLTETSKVIQPWLRQEHRLKGKIIRLEGEIEKLKNPAADAGQLWKHVQSDRTYLVCLHKPAYSFGSYERELVLVRLDLGNRWCEGGADPFDGDKAEFEYLGMSRELLNLEEL